MSTFFDQSPHNHLKTMLIPVITLTILILCIPAANASCIGLENPADKEFFGMKYIMTKDYTTEELGSAFQFQDDAMNKRLTFYRFKGEGTLDEITAVTLQAMMEVHGKEKAHEIVYPDEMPVSFADSVIKKFIALDKAEEEDSYTFLGVGTHNDCTIKVRYSTRGTNDANIAYKEFLVVASMFPLMYLDKAKYNLIMQKLNSKQSNVTE